MQDLILEPPHPWIVNEKTIFAVTEYNLERASYHYKQLYNDLARSNPAFFNHYSKECFMHLCAALLSNYGAFLGVGSKYGLLELRRILGLKSKNETLWEYCKINEIDSDLNRIGYSRSFLYSLLDKAQHHFTLPDDEKKFKDICMDLLKMSEVTLNLLDDNYPSYNNLKKVYLDSPYYNS